MSHLRPRAAGRIPRDDAGFTVVEVLVAATLLVIGAFATLALLDDGVSTTAVSKQQDVANALAQEMVERSTGGRYTQARNDMTDVDAASANPGPADRLRLGLDPDSDQVSGAVAPTTAALGAGLGRTPQTWTVRRRNTTYTVGYRACTSSDVVGGVSIAGPFDCDRSATEPDPMDTQQSGDCRIAVVANLGAGVAGAASTDPHDLRIRLQLLGALGVDLCVGALAPDLAEALCGLLGQSGVLDGLVSGLTGSAGALESLLGGVLRSSSIEVCPATQVEQGLAGPVAGIGTSTRVAVTVAWTDPRGQARSIARTTVVRRAAS